MGSGQLACCLRFAAYRFGAFPRVRVCRAGQPMCMCALTWCGQLTGVAAGAWVPLPGRRVCFVRAADMRCWCMCPPTPPHRTCTASAASWLLL